MISDLLIREYVSKIDFDPMQNIKLKVQEQLPVDYFKFYNAVSSVYSSKIEGEEIDFDSFYKFKFLNIDYNPDYTKKSDDLFKAYEFIQANSLTYENLLAAHKILSKHLLPSSHQGRIRNNPMFVLNEEDRIEYVACEPTKVGRELNSLFDQIEDLFQKELSTLEAFFYASQIHLIFVKIHPMQDGNGRTARLLEKWFLLEKIGKDAVSVDLEKNYFVNRKDYYNNIKKLGLEYENLDYSKALDFLLMTINTLK
ncbi:MAG: Fic family protein [Saprospiraceae bacterium]